MAGLDGLRDKSNAFTNSDKGGQLTDQGMHKAFDTASSATGGKIDEKIESPEAAADKKIGDE